MTQTPNAREARDAVHAALRRDAALEADRLSVDARLTGLAMLSGTVSCWAAYDHAVACAWSAPGVTQVDYRIHVESTR